MSGQESMCYPPEHAVQQGRAERSMDGEKIQPRRRGGAPRRRFIWLWVVATVVLLFALGLGVRAVGTDFQQTTVEPTLRYAVPATSHLVLHTEGGDVRIHGGSGNTIIVQATKHAGIFGSDGAKTDVSASQHGDTVAVTTQVENHVFLFSNEQSYVSLDITVPSNCAIQFTSATGNVDIEDVTGQAALHTQSGNITITDAQLTGTSSAISDAGDITFSGSLDAQGTYTFTTRTGDIDVTLPGTAAVNLHAQSLRGNVDNAFGSAAGSPPQAPVTVSTNTGDITIQKR